MNDLQLDNVISNFIILNTTKIFQESNQIHNEQIDNIINEIEEYRTITGIMVGNFLVSNEFYIYFLIFDEKIILVNQIDLSKFQKFIINHINKVQFYFLNHQCYNIIEKIKTNKNPFFNQNEIFTIEKDQSSILFKIKAQIITSIITKSRIRTNERHKEFISDVNFESKPDINNLSTSFKITDFIKIKQFNNTTGLYFNIKDQFLYVLKEFFTFSQQYKHEISFYKQIENNNPFISKYYGEIIFPKPSETQFIVIEYIDGLTLKDFIMKNKNQLPLFIKMQIIFSIIIAIHYIHSKGIILRDLKYDNIIIDSNNNAILIDFDKTIKGKIDNDDDEFTSDIGSLYFSAPEQYSLNKYSKKADIYSLGMIVHFIMTETQFNFDAINTYEKIHRKKLNILDLNEMKKSLPIYSEFYEFYKTFLEYSPQMRPNIDQIVNSLLKYLAESINEKKFIENENILKISMLYLTLFSNQNNTYAQYLLGLFYYEGKYVSRDINKSIHYLTLSSNKNDSNSQCLLGEIYYYKKYIPVDINKSIHYLTLSAKQNNSEAQYLLGEIYYLNNYVPININKSIYYLLLSAKQNNSDAQYLLGYIYYSGKNVDKDINKAIHYLTLSANQNNASAQYLLGVIYISSRFVENNIDKAIYYLKLSANQNHSDAQYLLGKIYYSNKLIKKDLNKAISYLKQSAYQNNSDALFFLGKIYYTGKFIEKDIKKALSYLTQSAKQNNSNANFLLGEIYYSGLYVSKDINKSIHYFKEASCFYNNKAKNNLGIIYKNGENVNKNIYWAIEFFNEAIIQKNDSYSRYNLSRIYYFGIDINKDINKAIEIIKPAADKIFLPSILFLYAIYSFGDQSIINESKAYYYQNLIENSFLFNYFDPLLLNYNQNRTMNFFKIFDLEYVSNNNFYDSLIHYMKTGSLKPRMYFNESIKTSKASQQKDIDSNFYDGFK